MTGADLLLVQGLHVRYRGAAASAVEDCDLMVAAGRTLAVVGPSGAGKSTLARALLGLLPADATCRGRVLWQGGEVRGEAAWRRVRGRGIGLVLQDPAAALSPVLTVGEQVTAPLRHVLGLDRSAAAQRAETLLAEVRLPRPAELAGRHAHQLSGGMRQRVCLAAALAGSPRLLIADEPTTALDVTTQRDVLRLLLALREQHSLALVFVTHDLALVPLVADDMLVMDGGRIVERGTVTQVLAAPAHAVTRGLLARPPAAVAPAPKATATPPVLSARRLSVVLKGARGRPLPVIDGIDLDLHGGHTVGLAGESGCGKTTLARALARHVPATGALSVGGEDLLTASGADLRRLRRGVQLVFQDPAGSLDPRQSVLAALVEAACAAGCRGRDARARAEELLAEVDLDLALSGRRPHELSGGQQRRVALARALAAAPSVLIADEPTTSLDAPTANRVIGLLQRIQARRGLALLIISHDLDLLRRVCHEVAVMHAGRLVEVVPGDRRARHPHARELIAASPHRLARENLRSMPPPPPSPLPATSGCPYAPRCPLKVDACGYALPPLLEVAPNHLLRCPVTAQFAPEQLIDTL